VLERIASGLEEACAAAGIPRTDLRATGIAAPGAMDLARGVVINAPNLGWRDYPLRDRLQAHLGTPVVVENDVNGAVLGECTYGAARGVRNALGVWVGTGVGGGLVFDGRLHHGPLDTAGEIGHTIAMPDAPEGERILEAYASRVGMARMIRAELQRDPDLPIAALLDDHGLIRSSRALADAWREGDAVAGAVVARAAHLLGVGIANVITMVAVDTVILGGGITEQMDDRWTGAVRAAFDEAVFPRRPERHRFITTTLRADAGLLGAAAVARSRA
jgi:glucokinase